MEAIHSMEQNLWDFLIIFNSSFLCISDFQIPGCKKIAGSRGAFYYNIPEWLCKCYCERSEQQYIWKYIEKNGCLIEKKLLF